MARKGQALGHSGKLTNTTIFQTDKDDLMRKMWQLMSEKEELQGEIEAATLEIDGWLQVLQCSSAPELEELVTDFTSAPALMPPGLALLHPPPPERQRMAQYCDVVTRLDVLNLMDCAQGYETEEGDLLITFPWKPPNRPNQDFLLLLTPGPDHTYSVSSHNLPLTVPVDDLEKDYLHAPQGPDGLRSFVAVVGQYTRPLYSRLQQIMALESSKVLGGSSVRHNKAATNLNFIVHLKLTEHPLLQAEFVLKFHPLDLLPHSVTAAPLNLSRQKQAPFPPRLQDTLDGVARRMTTAMFPQVLLEQDLTATSPTPTPREEEEESTVSSSSSASGPLFDME